MNQIVFPYSQHADATSPQLACYPTISLHISGNLGYPKTAACRW
jgi:hypothetical protein